MNKQSISSIFFFLFLIIFFSFHKVSKVTCKVNQAECNSDLQTKVDTLINKSFFFTDFHKEVSQLEGTNSIYLVESIEKKLSGEIILKLVQETVLYSVEFENQKYFLGKSGVVLPNLSNTSAIQVIWQNDQPILNENQVIQNYHTILKNFATIIKQQSNIQAVTLYWVSDSEIILEIESEPTFIFDLQTLETNSKKIGTILEAREIEEIEAPIQAIDMRFELPVLRTTQ